MMRWMKRGAGSRSIAVCLMALCAARMTHADDVFERVELSISPSQFASCLDALSLADAAQAANLQRIYDEFATQFRKRAAERKAEFDALPTVGGELVPWLVERCTLTSQFEEKIGAALDEQHRQLWHNETRRLRRTRVMQEIDSNQRMWSMQDLLGILDGMALTGDERAALAETNSKYQEEMDAAIRQWEEKYYPIMAQMYDNYKIAKTDQEKYRENAKRLQGESDLLIKAIKDVNDAFIDAMSDRLIDEHRAVFAEKVLARNFPDLYADGPVDAAVASLRALTSLTDQQRKSIESTYDGYIAARRLLRMRMVSVQRQWTAPRNLDRINAMRAELLAAEKPPMLALQGHPGIKHLKALLELEQATITELRAQFDPTEFEALPVEARLLLEW